MHAFCNTCSDFHMEKTALKAKTRFTKNSQQKEIYGKQFKT